MEIRRREFLKLFGGVSGALALGGCGIDDIMVLPQKLVDSAKNGPGLETWRNTVCGLCPAGCGMRVRLIDGVPVGVRGNPLSPMNRGGLCPLGLNALHSLYHPDRLPGPMRRTGAPGSGSWEKISWEDALTTVGNRLAELRRKGRSHEVAFIGYEEGEVMRQHIGRFMQAYGSPNYFRLAPAAGNAVPYFLQQGHLRIPACDSLNARLVVTFGANILEEEYSPIHHTMVYSHHQGQQTRYVVINPRRDLTAANADQWIPIRPGTFGALALGVAFVLIREELIDAAFIREHTFGYDDWRDEAGEKHIGFKSVVMGNYYPERVSEITGVPSATILSLAREIGNTKPAVVMCGQGASDNTNGAFVVMAVNALNALLGNFEKQGGVFTIDPVPFRRPPPVVEDAVAKNGNRRGPVALSRDNEFPMMQPSIATFVRKVLGQDPPPVEVLFLCGGNPVFHSLGRTDLVHALDRIPLVVSFDPVITETSEFAHLVLPDHHFLERWDVVSDVPSVGFTHVGIQHPVVSPFHDTRHTGDVLIALGKELGGTVAGSAGGDTYEEILSSALRGVYDAGEGVVTAGEAGGSWQEFLAQRGWQIGRYASFEEFKDRLVEYGGWWNPASKRRPWDQVFRTPSGKFEFYSRNLKEAIETLAREARTSGSAQDQDLLLNRLHITARGDYIFLPHHEPVPVDSDLPLDLVTFRTLTIHDGQGAHLPMMQEMFGHAFGFYWESWAELHPDTASRYGIADGGWIAVDSAAGVVRVRARVTRGIIPNAVAIPFGLGHTSYGRYAKGHGVNPNWILRPQYDLITGRPALHATRARIAPAS